MRERMPADAAHRFTEDAVTRRNLRKLETFESLTPTGALTPTGGYSAIQPPLKRGRFTAGDITQQLQAQQQRVKAVAAMPEPSAAPRRPMPVLAPTRSPWAFDELELEEAFNRLPVQPPDSPVAASLSVLASPSRIPVDALFDF